MAMTYNRALDLLALAATKMSEGKPILAAKFLTKASKSPDLARAIGIIEHSNGKAFAAVEAAKAKQVKAAKAKAKQVQATQRLKAELEGEDSDVADLVDDDMEASDDAEMADDAADVAVDDAAAADDAADMAVEDADDADMDEEGDFDDTLANVLASMTQTRKATPKKK